MTIYAIPVILMVITDKIAKHVNFSLPQLKMYLYLPLKILLPILPVNCLKLCCFYVQCNSMRGLECYQLHLHLFHEAKNNGLLRNENQLLF